MFAYFPLVVIPLVSGIGRSENSTSFVKCCNDGNVLNENFACEKRSTVNETFGYALPNMTNTNGMISTACFRYEESRKLTAVQGDVNHYTCVGALPNGTKVELICKSRSFVGNNTVKQCDSLFKQLKFWGATMVIFATIVYNIPFIIVVIIYCAFSELRTRAYDKSIICYNMCYIVINVLLIILGSYSLCHRTLSTTTYRLFGLSLMFSTQGVVMWLLIICFDMTLVITRFRWAPKSGVDRGREEKRKFLIYSTWAWGFSSVLTLVAAIVEFTPMFPEDSLIRPNFQNFSGVNVAVIVYVATGPVIVCLTTTSLFIYTTVKTIAVQKSTAILNENRKSNVKKKYLLFLKLYLAMDTPWFTSALGAIYDDLWVLKFIKMIQPIIMLVLIIPRKRLLRAMNCGKNKTNDQNEAERLKKKTVPIANLQARENTIPPKNC